MFNDKKRGCISPNIYNNKFVTEFSNKANPFNSIFPKHCSIIENNNVLLLSTNLITNQYLANIEFTKDNT